MWYNREGYRDPTAGEAVERVYREQMRESAKRELFGMTQREFYKSQSWKRTRAAYIKHRIRIDGGICEVCHDDLGFIVHHKVWLNDQNCNDPDVSLNFENLRYECQTCHNKESDPARRRNAPGRVLYGKNGEVLPK